MRAVFSIPSSCKVSRVLFRVVPAYADELGPDDWEIVECDYPDLVQLDSEGCMTGKVLDFFHGERLEMSSMSAPSEIAPNVWLGPTPDPNLCLGKEGLRLSEEQQNFDLLVECSDVAQIPDQRAFRYLEEILDRRDRKPSSADSLPNQLEFPGSGAIMPPTWSQVEVDGLLAMCQWIHKQANSVTEAKKRRDSKLSLTPEPDSDGDGLAASPKRRKQAGRKVLIHCADGYTETSLLALAYYMYANCVPVHDAWLQLHREKGRNFFAYNSDVHLLRSIQARILAASPAYSGDLRELTVAHPAWLDKMDGSLPSRILPYMYLGNLGHANNPQLLEELGIGQILSVGEPVSWPREAMESWPQENLKFIDKVQDNGVDPLTEEFENCLKFIGKPWSAIRSVDLMLMRCDRGGSQEGHCDTCTLPRWRFSIRHDLYRRGDERAGLVISSCLLFRASEEAQCDYPAAFAICVSIAIYRILRCPVF